MAARLIGSAIARATIAITSTRPTATDTYGLKLVLLPQGFQDAYSHNADPASSSVSDTTLLPYSTEYYQYNSDRRVTTATVDGLYAYTYAYTAATSAGGYNDWKEETVETRPDQNTYTVCTNFLGETLLTDLHDANENVHSYTYNQYGGDNSDAYEAAQLILTAGSLAISGTPTPRAMVLSSST